MFAKIQRIHFVGIGGIGTRIRPLGGLRHVKIGGHAGKRSGQDAPHGQGTNHPHSGNPIHTAAVEDRANMGIDAHKRRGLVCKLTFMCIICRYPPGIG